MPSDRTTPSPGSSGPADDPVATPEAASPEFASGDPRPPEARGDPSLSPEEEPVTTGTLFIMLLFLMAMGAMWGLMYLTLLSR